MVAVAGALSMICTRNPVHSALSLVVTFVAVAVIYLILSAPLLFAIQMIVYAGAIMVLFLFVIMFFMAPSARKWLRPPLKSQLAFGGLLTICLVVLIFLGFNLDGIKPYMADGMDEAGVAVEFNPEGAAEHIGNPRAIGKWLFSYHVLPFELTSILLLAALLGAMMLARDPKSEGAGATVHHAPQADEGDVAPEVQQ